MSEDKVCQEGGQQGERVLRDEVMESVQGRGSSQLREELECSLMLPGKEFSLRLQDMGPGIGEG